MAKHKQTKKAVAMAMAAAIAMSSMSLTVFAEELPDHIPAAPAADETPVEVDEPIDVTIVIPSEEDATVTENFGNPENTLEGDVPEDAFDEEYDYTITVEQGSVTVETEANENGENNVEFITGVVAPEEGNDIIFEEDYFEKAENYYEENELDTEDFLPAPGNEEVEKEELGKLDIPGEDDEERFELITQGATSQFRPLPVFTKPMSDEDKVAEYGDAAYIRVGESAYTYYINWLDAETKGTIAKNEDSSYVTDEEGYLLDVNGDRIVKKEQTVTVDGETYYMHRFDLGKQTINGMYNDDDGDGTWTPDDKTYKGVWEEAAQFVLVDKTTGELITTYLEDYYIKKYAVGAEYKMENLEDSEKFGEYADNLRAVAQAGYWGTAEGVGSLEAMKEDLLATGDFTEEELESLTDGVALAATQMAIYYWSNAKFGQEFINTNYDVSGNVSPGTAVPEDKKDEASLMFKVYNYLKGLEAVEEATKVEDIITNENFLDGEMEITVLEKAEDHESNYDDDDTNDAYTANLTFALVVAPSTENGDDLVVKVINTKTGEAIASGRVAGEETGDETHGTLVADENGNYTFTNIVMTEGDHTYNITMEGIQNLKESGVYLFTTDVPDGAKPQPSMIGMTSDKNVVNVESINFSFEVEDEKIVVRESYDEYVGESDRTPDTDPTPDLPEIPEEDVPLTELPELPEVPEELPEEEVSDILEEDVPLADVPLTSDATVPFMGMSILSAIGLFLTGKRRKED